MTIPGPEDAFDSSTLEVSSSNLPGSSRILEISSPNLEESSPNSNRDGFGRLISGSHSLPFVEDLNQLTPGYLETLQSLAEDPRSKKKIPRPLMREVLLKLLEGQFVTLSCLAELVSRDAETLRGQYLSEMVKKREVEIAFPRTPNDPRQAYTKANS